MATGSFIAIRDLEQCLGFTQQKVGDECLLPIGGAKIAGVEPG